MVDRVVLALAIGLGLLGLVLARRALDQARVVRQVRDLPVTPIEPTAPDLQRVRGRIEADFLLKSPFQGRDCVYYFFRVTAPREGKSPRTLATGKEWTLAKVVDGSGQAALEPWTAAVGSPRRHETVLRGLTKIPEGLETFFERAGIDPKHLPRLPVMTVHEFTMEPGDEVYVLGARKASDGSFHRARRRPFVVSADPDVGLLRGLRNELFVFAAIAPMVLVAALALGLMALLA